MIRGCIVAVLLTLVIFTACEALQGCSDYQPRINTARAAVAKQGEALGRVRGVLIAACSADAPPPTPQWCPDMLAAFNEVTVGYTLVNDALGELP